VGQELEDAGRSDLDRIFFDHGEEGLELEATARRVLGRLRPATNSN
jgi:hypothetical protein